MSAAEYYAPTDHQPPPYPQYAPQSGTYQDGGGRPVTLPYGPFHGQQQQRLNYPPPHPSYPQPQQYWPQHQQQAQQVPQRPYSPRPQPPPQTSTQSLYPPQHPYPVTRTSHSSPPYTRQRLPSPSDSESSDHDTRRRSHSRHEHNKHHDRRRSSHKVRDTFLGAGAGALIGDALVPGLGTAAGTVLGAWGGHRKAKMRTGETVDGRKVRSGEVSSSRGSRESSRKGRRREEGRERW